MQCSNGEQVKQRPGDPGSLRTKVAGRITLFTEPGLRAGPCPGAGRVAVGVREEKGSESL